MSSPHNDGEDDGVDSHPPSSVPPRVGRMDYRPIFLDGLALDGMSPRPSTNASSTSSNAGSAAPSFPADIASSQSASDAMPGSFRSSGPQSAASGDANGNLPVPPLTSASSDTTPNPRSPTPILQTQPMAPPLVMQQQQRSSLSTLMMMTFFFWFMNGGGGGAPISAGPGGGIDGDGTPTETWLDRKIHRLENGMDDYRAFLNGSGSSNFSYPAPVEPPVSTLLPPIALHRPSILHPPLPADDDSGDHRQDVYYRNMTGFYREGLTKFLNVTERLTGFNETIAEKQRGSWNWGSVDKWELNVRERLIVPLDGDINGTDNVPTWSDSLHVKRPLKVLDDWAWVGGSITWSVDSQTLDYDLTGLHSVKTGEYVFLASIENSPLDIRTIPALFHEDLRPLVAQLTLLEGERKLNLLRDQPVVIGGDGPVTDVNEVEEVTTCPMVIHLRSRPLKGYTAEMMNDWEEEERDPQGLGIRKPPKMQLDGVAISTSCGMAIELGGGYAISKPSFWVRSVHYAAFAAIINLIILLLTVDQMENARSPSAQAKISPWTIVMMLTMDSWIFSAHTVIGLASDNRASIPMLVPGFLALVTSVIFGPRFAVMLFRTQAVEAPPAPPPPPPPPRPQESILPSFTSGTTATGPAIPNATPTPPSEPPFSVMQVIRDDFNRYPNLKWILPNVLILVLLAFIDFSRFSPILLGLLYSFWLPQIWRNARRGTRKALNWRFVIGMGVCRIAMPLYLFACPVNVFFVETDDRIRFLPLWQVFQILILFIQERFGPAFFLPKSLAPPEAYDYHQPLPLSDPERPAEDFGSCSICMEHIIVHHVPEPSTDKSHQETTGLESVGHKIININLRNAYALAPCHHLFHTNCLRQWMQYRNTCPLCKRSLPPL